MAYDLKAHRYALHAVGFRPGDLASIISNAVEWVFADMSILFAGGVSSGIYPTDSAAQVEYLVNDSRTRVIFVEDEEQLDSCAAMNATTPEAAIPANASGRAATSGSLSLNASRGRIDQ